MSDDQGRRSVRPPPARCPAGGRIVEIGSFQGRSTIVLASARRPGVEVVAIDPHAGNDRGPQEIAGYADEAAERPGGVRAPTSPAPASPSGCATSRSFSDAAHGDVDDPIDVLYIDGAHRYGPARADIRDWGRRVGDGGTMLIHDSFSSIGVTLAIVRELLLGRRFRYVGRSRSLAEYRADLVRRRSRSANAAAPARASCRGSSATSASRCCSRWATASSPAASAAPSREWPY